MNSEQSSDAAFAVMRAARGLLCIFWGIPISLLLFSRALVIRTSFVIPAYLPGVMIVALGVVWLWGAGRMSPSWHPLVKKTLMALCIIIYFSPFMSWWEMLPGRAYLLTNVWLFMLSVAWLLHLLNRVTGDIAEQTGCRSLAAESCFCRWGIVLLMAAPLLTLYLRAALGAMIHGGSLFSEVAQILDGYPTWFMLLFLFPFPMTMANLWRARNQCLGRLNICHKPAEA